MCKSAFTEEHALACLHRVEQAADVRTAETCLERLIPETLPNEPEQVRLEIESRLAQRQEIPARQQLEYASRAWLLD